MSYWKFCDELRKEWGTSEVPDRLSLVFHVPMPASWSEKKKKMMDGAPHQQRPDIDNFIKAFLDALCEDDSYVWTVRATKIWGREACIDVDVI